MLGHPPGVVLGQALGEVPARRLVLEIDVGEGAASGVTLARKPVGLARLLARHQRFDDLARQLGAVVTQSSPHERRPLVGENKLPDRAVLIDADVELRAVEATVRLDELQLD